MTPAFVASAYQSRQTGGAASHALERTSLAPLGTPLRYAPWFRRHHARVAPAQFGVLLLSRPVRRSFIKCRRYLSPAVCDSIGFYGRQRRSQDAEDDPHGDIAAGAIRRP